MAPETVDAILQTHLEMVDPKAANRPKKYKVLRKRKR